MTIPITSPKPQPGSFVEKRAASDIGSTSEVLAGTLVNVPSANPTGAVPDKPVVAVNTTSQWRDPQFLLSVVLGVGGIVTAVWSVIAAAAASGPINWMVTGPAAFAAGYGSLTAFLRQRTNTVTK